VQHHKELLKEFAAELEAHGRIYMYRYKPSYDISARKLEDYPCRSRQAAAIMLMLSNNLDPAVAQHPHELITYGGNGTVFQNWAQYRLTMRYLSEMIEEQTLVLYSGHPLGLFPSSPYAPRLVVTCGMVVPHHSRGEDYERLAALGVTSYGQMTAGSYMYIGPQGIVHGTAITVMNAGRLYLGAQGENGLRGKVFLTAGLGGMSGAQGKAIEIANGVGIIAEVDNSRIQTRLEQGWVDRVIDEPAEAFRIAARYQRQKKSIAIAFYGNVVDLLEYAVSTDVTIDLLSDQTSCHAVYEGGYCPQGISFEERTELLQSGHAGFKEMVDATLRRHYELIKTLADRGTYFFDYGNSFLKAVFDAGVKEICKNGRDPLDGFIFHSYVEDIMGPILFDYGYGPFRWVCLSGKASDLKETDRAAMESIDPQRRFQDRDNYIWIRDAGKNKLVVGTQARILYQDAMGRMQIALRFNEMVRNGEIGQVMLGRDHHDTGGTDSPFRETANIKDGSNITADMAIHCFAGNAARGMSLAALHNGGGVGIGNAINGGFGLVLDGSKRVAAVIRRAIPWDVMGGVARRAWARNENSIDTGIRYNAMRKGKDHITIPYIADDKMIEKLVMDKLRDKD